MPPATLALLGANIAAFLLQGQAGPELIIRFALWPPGIAGAPPFEPWQLGGWLMIQWRISRKNP